MTGHAEHHAHGEGGSKRIALLISVLALLLAISSTAANNAQTTALQSNVEASNLWAFFQARTIRQTVLRASSETVAALADDIDYEQRRQMDAWKETIARWEDDPQANDGRRQLTVRAK